MAAKDNVGNQFVEVFRGLYGVSPETLDKENLGRHWSTNPYVAKSFASDWGDGSDDPTPSVLISGVVRQKNIIPYGTEEWDNEAGDYGVDIDGFEAEQTIRPGSRVHVTGITHYPDDTSEKQHISRDQMSFKELRKYRA